MIVLKHILLGIFFIIIGIGILIYTYKHPIKSIGLRPNNGKGYIAGVGFLILGVLELFDYWKW